MCLLQNLHFLWNNFLVVQMPVKIKKTEHLIPPEQQQQQQLQL